MKSVSKSRLPGHEMDEQAQTRETLKLRVK